MSTIRSLPVSTNIIEEVAAMLHSDKNNFSQNIVVFPGKRPAHFLRKMLAQKAKQSIIPPRIFSIDNFVDFLFREKLGRRERLVEQLDAVAILHEIYLSLEQKPGGEHFLTLDRFLPLGIKLFTELEELKIANIPAFLVREKVGAISYGQVRSLALLYEKFYAEVERRSFVTRAQQYNIVANQFQLIEIQEYQSIILAGFFALTISEQLLFRALLDCGNVALLYQEGKGIEKHVQNLSNEIARRSDALPSIDSIVKPQVNFYKSSDAHGQIFALSQLIHELKEKGETLDEKTVIVLPAADALFPVVNHVLPLIEKYNISHSYPIVRTPMFGFFNSLMNVIETMDGGNYYAPSYIKFVLHPYTKNIRYGKRADVTRVLFHSIEEYFVERKSQTFFSLEELEQEPRIYEAVRKVDESFTREAMEAHLRSIHDALLRSFTHFSSLGDFAEKSMNVLEYIFNNSTANLHSLFRPFAMQCIESLELLRSSLLHDRSFDESASYFSFLRHYFSTVEVPFTGTPLQGVQVLGQLETRNLKFERVFVLDVNDDVIPRAKGENLLLPQQVRRALHLTTYHDGEETSSYYFDMLIAGAKEVHLFFIENGQKERSRLIEKLLWERQKALKNISEAEFVRTIRSDISLANDIPKPIEKTERVVSFLNDFIFSATALDTYLQCQLKFYYRYILRLYEKEIVSGDVEHSDVGTIVHKALAEFFQPWRGHPLEEKELRWENLEAIVDRCFATQFGNNVIGAVYLLRNQLKKHLRDFLEGYQYQILRRSKTSIVDVENTLEIEKNGVRFRGILDRVETRGDHTIILDYKTNSNSGRLKIRFDKLDSSHRETWEQAIGSLQLPLYMLMYGSYSNISPEKISASYVYLGNQVLNDECEVPLFENEQLAQEFYPKIEEVIFRLVSEIQNPALPFTPTKNLQDHCPVCPFTSICGTSWVRQWSNS